MTKTIAQIRAGHQYTDKKTGEIRDRTLNIPHYFKDIPFIYSPHLEKGRVKFSAEMQKLYCYVADWEKSGSVCYEEQSEIAKVCGLERRQTINLITTLEIIGLITRTKIPGRRNRELRALPLTDAHITPPETQQEAPDEAPAPTMTKVIEEAVIVPESAPESAATTMESDQTVIDDDMALEVVCKRLSQPESLRQSQRYDTFTAYARRVLRNDGKRLSRRIEERLEERFEQLYPHLYSRFGIPF